MKRMSSQNRRRSTSNDYGYGMQSIELKIPQPEKTDASPDEIMISQAHLDRAFNKGNSVA